MGRDVTEASENSATSPAQLASIVAVPDAGCGPALSRDRSVSETCS
ncbi:protein of unassigned function [Methylobacterium oryzae CBMB20]|uniref:Protein of unassigned function n=1 Tax=Methylobacterium oryzae CBMB20 TaxID=693986 RepID=A0A089NVZ8_9HYPH|nr:protein of unassigned function [Methylobacterium oryzae CBMB20]